MRLSGRCVTVVVRAGIGICMRVRLGMLDFVVRVRMPVFVMGMRVRVGIF